MKSHIAPVLSRRAGQVRFPRLQTTPESADPSPRHTPTPSQAPETQILTPITPNPWTVLALAALAATSGLHAQGSLTPPGAPAPTMKSLQEIWDRVGDVESANAILQAQNTELQQLIAPIYEKLGIQLPWTIETIDSTGDVGAYASLAVAPTGEIGIAYYDANGPDMKYAGNTGSGWVFDVARANPSFHDYGKHASLAFSSTGEPGISFHSASTPKDLNYSQRSEGTWSWEAPDGVGSNSIFGTFTSLAFDSDDHPAIAYFAETNGHLKLARYDGGSWNLETVDSSATTGQYPSLVFLPSGQPAISYYRSSSGDLKYATYTGAAWSIIDIDTTDDVGQFSSMALDPQGHPAIAYYDATNTDLKFASFDGATWSIETAVEEPTKDIGKYASLAFGPSGLAAIACHVDGIPADLIFVSFDGTEWSRQTVDGVGSNNVLGKYYSLAFNPAGQPMIAYYDETNGDLKFASRSPFSNP